ncbi:MAG: GerMN domain-containing protein [Bacillota bacterium]|nr:GerMN domain-containing protein [Bacillota bacterium]MDW7729066.1 GerMN domain-containing protein [Bacillota bacterium]
MKRMQPYYYIVALAGLFLLAGLILFSLQLFPTAESTGITVDPQTDGQGEALYDLWFTATGIYDFGVDHALSLILYSADNNTVNLLDRDRKLLWEKVFATSPKQAKISACGGYAVIGTDGGRIYFTSTDQQTSWNDEGDPVDLLAMSPSATWIAAARTYPGQEYHHIDFFSQAGRLNWQIETGAIQNLYLSSEYLEQAHVYFTSIEEELPVIKAINLEGEEMWSYENQSLVAVSRHGSRLAAVQENRIIVYDSLGYALWSTALPFEVKNVMFNPQNYNRILVYGSREGAGENLYYFDLAEDLLWMKRIADGSLFSFTADGQNIITSSWRHFKEDFTQMILLDRDGNEINSWEVAMRVEHLLVTGHPNLIVVGGEDGYIDLIDLQPLLSSVNGNGIPEVPLYSPVITGLQTDQTRITLYFADDNANLIPVSRLISLDDNPLRAALEELIRGPARGSSLYRTIPDKDVSIEVDFDNIKGLLYLDLSQELLNFNGSIQSEAALNSLIKTVSDFKNVKEIYLTVNRVPADSFGSLDIELPLEPQHIQKPVYVPVASGSRYYLDIREGAAEDPGEVPIENLLEQVLRTSRSMNFVPSDLALIDIKVSSEQVQINLNDSFMELFPEVAGETEKLQAALILDALFLTAFENGRRQRAEIIVEGEYWTPPEGYPPLNRFYRQPFFINPE